MKKIVCLALALLMVLGLAACSGGGGKASSYESAIEDYFDYQTGKATKKTIENMAPAEYWENSDESVEDIWDEYEESFEDFNAEMEEEVGENVKYSYKITDKEEFDEDELEEFAEYLEEEYDIDPDTVTAGYDVSLEITIKGSDDKQVNEVNWGVVKIGNNWYISLLF